MAKFYEKKDRTIMCPKCKKYLTKADSTDPTLHKLACENCHKWIWYVPKDMTTEIHEVPMRTASSGKVFY